MKAFPFGGFVLESIQGGVLASWEVSALRFAGGRLVYAEVASDRQARTAEAGFSSMMVWRKRHASVRACGEFHEPLARDHNRYNRAGPTERDIRSATLCSPLVEVGGLGILPIKCNRSPNLKITSSDNWDGELPVRE